MMPKWIKEHKHCDHKRCSQTIIYGNALEIAMEALQDIYRGQGLKPTGMSTPPVSYSRDSLRLKAEEAMSRISALDAEEEK